MPLFDFLEFISDPQPRPAAMNMAIDEILLEKISVPALRVYRWLRPAVSFGCFEKYSAVEKRYSGREFVRRWTGGGIVLHGEDFTYSLLVPSDCALADMSPAHSYSAIHESLAQTMTDAGVPAFLTSDVSQNNSSACFENAVPHDIMLDNRKIAGAAQRRTRNGLLHQGSIQGVELPANFAEGLAASLAAKVSQRSVTPSEVSAALALAESKYAAQQWTRKF